MNRVMRTAGLLLLLLVSACASYGSPGREQRDAEAADAFAPTDATGDVRAEIAADAMLDALEGSDAPDDAAPSTTWSELPWELGGDLRAAWGRAFDQVLAVGDGGTVLRFNGRWAAPLDLGLSADLLAVDGSEGTVALAGAGGALFVSVGGAAFVAVPTGVTASLRGVAVLGADDVLAVGDGGTILRVRGGVPEVRTSNTTASLRAAWGSADGDRVAVDEAGGVFREINGVWLRSQVAPGGTRLAAVAGPDLSRLLVVGEHGVLEAFDGLAWKALLSNDAASRDLSAVRVLSDGEAWATGSDGVLLRRDAGAALDAPFALEEILGPTLLDADVRGLVVETVGGVPRGVLAVAGPSLLVNAGDGWRDAPVSPRRTLRDALALPDGSVLAVGDDGLVARLSGTRWTALPLDEARDLDGLALSDDGREAWMGTDGALLRLDLATLALTEVPLDAPGRVRALARDLFVGDGGLVGRVSSDGSARRLETPEGLGRVYAAIACPDGATWAAGEAGALLVVRGDDVRVKAVGTAETLRAVTCTGAGILAAGENGVMVAASEAGVPQVVRRQPGFLIQAIAWRDGEAWLAGLDGRVLRGSSTAGWRAHDLPWPVGIEALTTAPDGRLLALGVNGRAFALETP